MLVGIFIYVNKVKIKMSVGTSLSDMSDFFAESENDFQVLKEYSFIFWCLSQFNGYRHENLLNLTCIIAYSPSLS